MSMSFVSVATVPIPPSAPLAPADYTPPANLSTQTNPPGWCSPLFPGWRIQYPSCMQPAVPRVAAPPRYANPSHRLAFKQEDQLDDQNNHHSQFQDEAPGLMELSHHELVELTRRAKFLVNKVSIVRHSHFGCCQAVEARVEHIAQKLDGVIDALGQFRNLEAQGVQTFCLPRELPTGEESASLVQGPVDPYQHLSEYRIVMAEFQ